MTKMLFASTALAAFIAPRAFMSDVCETVFIQGDNGEPLMINKTDYNEKKHKLFKGDKPTAPATAGPATAEALKTAGDKPPATTNDGDKDKRTLGVIEDKKREKGHKFVVVDQADGSVISDIEGIDIGGYATVSDAWAAIMKLNEQPAAS